MSAYDVGYGKPPLASRFQKGQSGNPAGRKKGSRNLATMVQEALDEKVVVNMNGRRRRVSKLQAAFIQQSNRAAGGDPKATKLMIDILVGAQVRDGASGGDATAPAERQLLNAQVIAALKARLAAEDEDHDPET